MEKFGNADKKLKYKNKFYYVYYKGIFFSSDLRLVIVNEDNKKIFSKKINRPWIIFNDNYPSVFESFLDSVFNEKKEEKISNFMDLDKKNN